MVLVFNLFAWRRKVPSWLKSSRLLHGAAIIYRTDVREVSSRDRLLGGKAVLPRKSVLASSTKG